MEREFSASSANCPCDIHSCPTMIQASHRVNQMHPRLAVASAAKEAPTSAFVNRVAVATLREPRYRRAGAAKMFIRHILYGQRSIDYPHWYHSAIGIVNVFDGIYTDGTQVEDAAILQELHSSYWRILDVFWEERQFLHESVPLADERRVIVSEVIGMYLRYPRLKTAMYETKTMTLVMDCWLKSSLKHEPRRLTVETAYDMLNTLNPNGSPPDDFLKLFFNVVDIDYLISQVISALNHKKHFGYCLARELSLISELASDKEAFVPHFITRNLYKHVKNAMCRQMKIGGEHTEDVLAQSSMILCIILENSSDFMATFTEMLEDTRIVEAGASALVMANRSHTSKAEIWFHLFTKINHIMACPGDPCPSCKSPVPESFQKAARTSLERVAIPTWEALRQAPAQPSETAKYLALWHDIILRLGITRKSIRERYRLEKKCCNLDCPTRNSGGRCQKKSTCVRCYSVYYCDRVCQRNDWKNIHKNECKNYAEDSD